MELLKVYFAIAIVLKKCYTVCSSVVTGGAKADTYPHKNKHMKLQRVSEVAVAVKLQAKITKRRIVDFLGKLRYIVLVVALGGPWVFVYIQVAPEVKDVFSDKRIVIENPLGHPAQAKEVEKPSRSEDCYSAADVIGEKYNVPVDLLKKIVKAESGNNHLAENKGSTATGCSQWIISSWRSYGKKLWGDDFHSKNIYSPYDNVELMAWTIANYGTSPWDASRSVWGK